MSRSIGSAGTTPLPGDDLLRARIRARLADTGPGTHARDPWLAGLPPELTTRFHHLIPAEPTPAAVLVPIVDHPGGLTVLLTQRGADLKHHPGQISFPGGRLEPSDADALVVGFVRPGFELKLDATEVTEAFEVPLRFVLDPTHHKARRRQLGEGEIEVYDIPYGARNIWGATAGMLMTLYRLLRE